MRFFEPIAQHLQLDCTHFTNRDKGFFEKKKHTLKVLGKEFAFTMMVVDD
jgi:hypothetical protein